MIIKTNSNGRDGQKQARACGKQSQSVSFKANLEMRRHELRAEVAEWFETASINDTTSLLYVLTVVQRPGNWGTRTLTQAYKYLSAAMVESTRLLAEVMADCGARSFTAEIGDDRFVVTTDNRYKITLVIE